MMRSVACLALLVTCLGIAACSKSKGGSSGDNNKGDQSTSKSNDSNSKSADSSSKSSDTVSIPAEDQARAGIRVGAVEVRSMPRTLGLSGQVQMDEQLTSHLGVLADGRITEVNVLPDAFVHRGQTLASLHSHLIHETVGALVQANAALERQRSALAFAEQQRNRYNHLYSIQAASLEESQRAGQEVQQAKNMLVDAQASVRMETEHLSELLQVPPEFLTPDHLYDRELVPVRAVADGIVIARNVTVGQVVNTGFEAFTISNLNTVWVSAALNERDLHLIRNGSHADVYTQSFPDQAFPGRVTAIGNTLDPQTRTLPVRITVANPGTRLRPGMFASVKIAGVETQTSIFVPEGALQDINGIEVVFTTQDGTSFKAQTVKIGTRTNGRAEILEGLVPGTQIVTSGAFMVKSAMLKGTMGEG